MSFSLPYACFVFSLQALQDVKLPPYKGSTLRGALGRSFKQLCCLTREGICSSCMFVARCAYAYVFETPAVSVGGNFDQRFVPHPFIIEPPLDGREFYNAGEGLEFNLLLLGKGLDYLPFFICAFERAALRGLGADRGPFALKGVDQLVGSKRRPIWRGGAVLAGEPEPVELADLTHKADGIIQNHELSELILLLQTPIRLVNEGNLSGELSFSLLMRSIFRRLDLLGRAHGSGPLELPFRDLLEQASKVKTVENRLTWQDWARYSARQKTHVLMGGLTGRITYSGRLQPFLPYVSMAQVVHIGKGTVYGLGKFLLAGRNGKL